MLKNKITARKDFQPVPQIIAHGGEMQQVFLNLVLNAMHAIGKQGILTVSLRCQGEWVKIIFEDSGVGIPPNILPRIFEPFFTTKEKQGTGLGLAVSYSIIKAYGGEIYVESEENNGTKFTIELPVPQQEIANRSRPKGSDETLRIQADSLAQHFIQTPQVPNWQNQQEDD